MEPRLPSVSTGPALPLKMIGFAIRIAAFAQNCPPLLPLPLIVIGVAVLPRFASDVMMRRP